VLSKFQFVRVAALNSSQIAAQPIQWHDSCEADLCIAHLKLMWTPPAGVRGDPAQLQSGVMQLLRLFTVLAMLGHVHLSAAGRAVLQAPTAPPPPYETGMFSIPPPPRTTQHRFAECNVHVNILAVISRVHVLRQKLFISPTRIASWHPVALCWFCQRLIDAEVAHHKYCVSKHVRATRTSRRHAECFRTSV
jgi:hypothetical protein